MISKVRIQNLKSIKDSGMIEIKPLTVVIGKNSSGKSSFLRMFPLLKQSFVSNLSEPILWFHEEFVDFGSFRNSLNSSCSIGKDTINMTFVFQNIKPRERLLRFYEFKNIGELQIKICIAEHYISEIELLANGINQFLLTYSLEKKEYNLSINGEKIDGVSFAVPENGRKKFPMVKNESDAFFYPHIAPFSDDIIKKYAGRNAISGRAFLDVDRISLDKSITLESVKERAKKLVSRTFRIDGPIDEQDIKTIANNLAINTAISLLDYAEEKLNILFTNVQYFQPIRARGDRFYRVQGLNTKIISSDGNNGPMFLFNLSQAKREKFEEWCLNNFGFTYSISKKTDGVESTSITIKTKNDDQERNMTDVGFGYSQIFPIILSLWNDIDTTNKKEVEEIYVIEQPELHLHPAFQRKIMKAIFDIIKISKEIGISAKFIIETHSETIVNYIGEKIYESNVGSDVNLLVCEKIKNESKFEKMIFNDDGTIDNWPSGFFSDKE